MTSDDRRRIRLLAVLAVLAIGLAACGSDDDGDGNGTGATPDAGIQSVDDLGADHIVAVQDGTTGQAWAQENLPPDVAANIRSFAEGPDGYTSLEACQVDAVINDESTAVAEVRNRPDLEIVETIDTGEVYGIAVDPENEALLEAVNVTLAEIMDDGTYDEFFDRYRPLPPGANIVETGGAQPPGGEAPDFSTKEEGVLTVGSDIPYPPFEFREDGELTGFDIDLITEIADRLGLEIEVVDTGFDTIFTQLASGRFDVVIAASTITEEREQTVNFSEGYFNAQQSLTVNPNC